MKSMPRLGSLSCDTESASLGPEPKGKANHLMPSGPGGRALQLQKASSLPLPCSGGGGGGPLLLGRASGIPPAPSFSSSSLSTSGGTLNPLSGTRTLKLASLVDTSGTQPTAAAPLGGSAGVLKPLPSSRPLRLAGMADGSVAAAAAPSSAQRTAPAPLAAAVQAPAAVVAPSSELSSKPSGGGIRGKLHDMMLGDAYKEQQRHGIAGANGGSAAGQPLCPTPARGPLPPMGTPPPCVPGPRTARLLRHSSSLAPLASAAGAAAAGRALASSLSSA